MGKGNLLIVEDDFLVASGLRTKLEEMGYQIIGLAPSGEEALEHVGRQRPDLVLMDIKVQGNSDGIETAVRLHKEYDIPSVFLTAYAENDILERAKKSEPYGYLVKPYEQRELQATIEMALYKAKLDRQLKESYEKVQLFRAIADASQVAIAIHKPDGSLIYVNSAYERLFGRSFNESLGSNYRDCYPAQSIEILSHKVEPLLRRGHGWEGELEAAGGCGRRLLLWQRSDSIRDANGRLAYAFSLMFDVTDKKRAEERRLEVERQHLQAQKLETIGVLVAGIAHDFNNLHGIVTGGLEMALLQLPATASLREPLKNAFQAALKARDLTRQLLAYAGKGLKAPKRVNLNEFVMEKHSLLEASISKSTDLITELSPDPLFIQADHSSVEQILLNLVVNASEAYEGQKGSILLRAGSLIYDESSLCSSGIEEKPPAGPYVFIEVSDKGRGMDAETNRRIFEPFFTTKFIGRGLGMAAVKGIVQAHKGAIFVKSTAGQGTTVRVILPAL
jgi:two-component system, cell cycle sensor histidine kinase and response regulator CckA